MRGFPSLALSSKQDDASFDADPFSSFGTPCVCFFYLLYNLQAALSVGDNTKGPEPTPARPAAKVRFAVVVEAHAGPTAEPTKQVRRAPIKIVGGRAWSPGIYQALRLLGIAWEKAFIHPLTFN
jgi:hypothetical protein